MLAKLTSFDFGKFSLTTSSGFVVAVAVMFIIDSLVGGHMTENILTDISAGKIVVFGLAALVSSSVLGFMLDCIYDAFGRRYAELIWRSLWLEKRIREDILNELHLDKIDFEWVYITSTGKMSSDEEAKFLRLTTAAGSTAYTMMYLLAPAAYMFLRMEYHRSAELSMAVAVFIAISGFILILTSSSSLAKYERKKTAGLIEHIDSYESKATNKPEIKNESKIENKVEVNTEKKTETKTDTTTNTITESNTGSLTGNKTLSKLEKAKNRVVDIASIRKDYKSKEKTHNSTDYHSRMSLAVFLVLPMIIFSSLILFASYRIASNQISAINQESSIALISRPEIVTGSTSDVPTLDIVVKKGSNTTADRSGGKVIVFGDLFAETVNIRLLHTNLVDSFSVSDSTRPQWVLNASLSNYSSLKNGDHVYLNVFLSFPNPSVEPLKTDEGEWLLPVIVTVNEKQYLLAQVHVAITAVAAVQSSSQNTTAHVTL